MANALAPLFLKTLCAAVLAAFALAQQAAGALPPGEEEKRIEARRASAPEELILRVESAEIERRRRFRFIGRVVEETHTLRGTVASVERSEAGLEEGSPFVLRIALDVARIERERRAHRRELRRGWVGPQRYFMAAPAFSEGRPDEENAYAMPAWVRVEEGGLAPGAGAHSFGRPVPWADHEQEGKGEAPDKEGTEKGEADEKPEQEGGERDE